MLKRRPTTMTKIPTSATGALGRQPSVAAGAASAWTEEMHTSFMNNMEAAFIHNILFRWPSDPAVSHQRLPPSPAMAPPPRLDRYMPDSAESTSDGRRAAGNVKRSSADISEQQHLRQHHSPSHGGKPISSTRHPAAKQSHDNDDDHCDQVVPLFQVPQNDCSPTGDGGGSKRRRS